MNKNGVWILRFDSDSSIFVFKEKKDYTRYLKSLWNESEFDAEFPLPFKKFRSQIEEYSYLEFVKFY